ncbi:peptidase M37 [Klebsiella pneumoniae]|uniref:Peptidase M37 n=1 Tax=Klebsiella pneumoniae TaxID=573 RepID=A0A377ZX99_KLEPN|nr:peptidase M37 [Klebsiella pneumoniae]
MESVGGQLLITADHGNAEQMRDPATGQAHTAHTNLPVPLIYVGNKAVKAVNGGKLSDIAPDHAVADGNGNPARDDWQAAVHRGIILPMRGKAMYSTTWIAAAVRSVLYASALSAGVLLCASSAHADDRDQLKSIQADIAARQRAIKQQQQQRASLLAQLKAQEEAIAAAARKLRETQDSLNQLNKQIDEMNAALAKLERQRASQERNLAAQLDAAFRQGPHTGIQMVLSGEEGQRNQRMQVYFSYFNQARQETIAEVEENARRDGGAKVDARRKTEPAANAGLRAKGPAGEAGAGA